MIAALTYVMIAAGVEAKTDRFWVSFTWPYQLGKIIGSHISKSEESKK